MGSPQLRLHSIVKLVNKYILSNYFDSPLSTVSSSKNSEILFLSYLFVEAVLFQGFQHKITKFGYPFNVGNPYRSLNKQRNACDIVVSPEQMFTRTLTDAGKSSKVSRKSFVLVKCQETRESYYMMQYQMYFEFSRASLL